MVNPALHFSPQSLSMCISDALCQKIHVHNHEFALEGIPQLPFLFQFCTWWFCFVLDVGRRCASLSIEKQVCCARFLDVDLGLESCCKISVTLLGEHLLHCNKCPSILSVVQSWNSLHFF